MDIKEVSSNSLSFIGDAVYTLNVRTYFVEHGYQGSNKLQYLCNKYNSAKGQKLAFELLKEKGFFTEEELYIYKRGRNNIRHIPKSSDLLTYQIASGLEAVVGYLHMTDSKRCKVLFSILAKEVFINA